MSKEHTTARFYIIKKEEDLGFVTAAPRNSSEFSVARRSTDAKDPLGPFECIGASWRLRLSTSVGSLSRCLAAVCDTFLGAIS